MGWGAWEQPDLGGIFTLNTYFRGDSSRILGDHTPPQRFALGPNLVAHPTVFSRQEWGNLFAPRSSQFGRGGKHWMIHPIWTKVTTCAQYPCDSTTTVFFKASKCRASVARSGPPNRTLQPHAHPAVIRNERDCCLCRAGFQCCPGPSFHCFCNIIYCEFRYYRS